MSSQTPKQEQEPVVLPTVVEQPETVLMFALQQQATTTVPTEATTTVPTTTVPTVPTTTVPVPTTTVPVPTTTVPVPGPTVPVPGPTVPVPGPTAPVPGPTAPAAPSVLINDDDPYDHLDYMFSLHREQEAEWERQNAYDDYDTYGEREEYYGSDYNGGYDSY